MGDGCLALIKLGAQNNDWLGFEEDLVWRIAPAGAVLDFVGNQIYKHESRRLHLLPHGPLLGRVTARPYNRTARTGELGRL